MQAQRFKYFCVKSFFEVKFMKKAILLAGLLLGALTTAQAQGFQFGLRFDPQLAWLNENSEFIENDGAQLGYKFGLMADIGFRPNYAISTGIFLDQRGGQIAFNDNIPDNRQPPDDEYFEEHRMQFVEIPVTLRLRSNEMGKGLRVYGQAGLNLAILTEYKISGREIGGGQIREFSDRDFDHSRPINPSFTIGMGVEYPLSGELALMSGVHYNQGIINASSLDNYEYNTSRMALQLGLLF